MPRTAKSWNISKEQQRWLVHWAKTKALLLLLLLLFLNHFVDANKLHNKRM